MARRRRSKRLTMDDASTVFRIPLAAGAAVVFGAMMIMLYLFMEPAPGVPGDPMSSIQHAFWEAIAFRAFWPGVALLCLGSSGFAVLGIRALLDGR